MLGGLLGCFRISAKWVWAGTGALAGLGLYAVLALFPALIDESPGSLYAGPEDLAIAPAFILAGACSALLFRTMIRALAAYNAALRAD